MALVLALAMALALATALAMAMALALALAQAMAPGAVKMSKLDTSAEAVKRLRKLVAAHGDDVDIETLRALVAERDMWRAENAKKQEACEQMGRRIAALEAEVAAREQAARWEGMEKAAQLQVISVIDEIADERRRQTDVEGWTLEHDDEHVNGEMAQAAAAYTFCAIGRYPGNRQTNIPIRWPWSTTSWKPREPRRDLIRAAALIVAEIERLDRAAAKEARDE
jgi:hypothetical protein